MKDPYKNLYVGLVFSYFVQPIIETLEGNYGCYGKVVGCDKRYQKS